MNTSTKATFDITLSGAPRLLGRYDPPPLRKGDRVYCRYRKGWCYVTGWSTGLIRWPRVQQIGVRGRPGLLVNATMERAIRTESALALVFWFGLSTKPVTWWRRRFGVIGHVGTPGTRDAHRKKSRKLHIDFSKPLTSFPGQPNLTNPAVSGMPVVDGEQTRSLRGIEVPYLVWRGKTWAQLRRYPTTECLVAPLDGCGNSTL